MKRKVSNDPLKIIKKIKVNDNVNLPIHEYKNRILDDVKKFDNYIIISTTGSGKTTQIPQFLFENNINNGKTIGISQPRRLATISIATRVAEELNCKLSETVGYSVRFENECSDKTKIKFMTDGILLREAVLDPLLKSYSIIILDEVHERLINNDILLGVVKNAQKVRLEQKMLPLKIIIMSATINHEPFMNYLEKPHLLSVKTRAHDLKLKFLEKMSEDYVQDSVITCLKIHVGEILVDNVNKFAENTQWSILIFLTGEDEINRCCELLKNESNHLVKKNMKGLSVFPLYSALPSEMQKQAVSSSNDKTARNVIVSTNIAETSITIPGVRVVIDCGFSKQKFVNATSGLESLVVCPISQAQAAQRAGRASRLGPGMCFRLYTMYFHETTMPEETQPELNRTSLTSVSLTIFGLGFHDINQFPWLDKPNANQVKRSIDCLNDLGAIEPSENSLYQITPLGRKLLRFPLDPRLAFAILEAGNRDCLVEVTAVVAMLNVVEKLFHNNGGDGASIADEFYSYYGDLVSLLRVYRAFCKLGSAGEKVGWCRMHCLKVDEMKRAVLIHKQLKEICRNLKMQLRTCNENLEEVVRCFIKPYSKHIAQAVVKKKTKKTSTFSTEYQNPDLTNLSLMLHPTSVLCRNKKAPEKVLYIDCIETSKRLIRFLSVVKSDWVD